MQHWRNGTDGGNKVRLLGLKPIPMPNFTTSSMDWPGNGECGGMLGGGLGMWEVIINA